MNINELFQRHKRWWLSGAAVLVVIIIGIIWHANAGYKPAKDADISFSGYNRSTSQYSISGDIPEKISAAIIKKLNIPAQYGDKLNAAEKNSSLQTGPMSASDDALNEIAEDGASTDVLHKLQTYKQYMQDIYVVFGVGSSSQAVNAAKRESSEGVLEQRSDPKGLTIPADLHNGQKVSLAIFVKQDAGNPIKTSSKTVTVSRLKKTETRPVSSLYKNFHVKFSGFEGASTSKAKGLVNGKNILEFTKLNGTNYYKNGKTITLSAKSLANDATQATNGKIIYKPDKDFVVKVSGLTDPKTIDVTAFKKDFLSQYQGVNIVSATFKPALNSSIDEVVIKTDKQPSNIMDFGDSDEKETQFFTTVTLHGKHLEPDTKIIQWRSQN